MRHILGKLAPRSKLELLWKTFVICGAIASWNIIWNWHLSGQQPRHLLELLTDAFVVGGPFAALSMIGSWYQVKAIDALNVRARIDPLSGLLNRQTFIGRLKRALPASNTGMLLLLDADHFKKINDQHGHAAGDRCIEAIGHRLKWHLRDVDLVGRIGGEEFSVFLPNVSKEHGRTVATRIGQPVSFVANDNEHIAVNLSIGAIWTSSERSVEDQIMDADDALYSAKTSGRSRMIISKEDSVILLGGHNVPSVRTLVRRKSSRAQVA